MLKALSVNIKNAQADYFMHLSANVDNHKPWKSPTHTLTHTKTHSRTPHTGAVYPSCDGDVGPCRPMSVLGEGKYFHCEGIFSCQQSDRALARDRRFP